MNILATTHRDSHGDKLTLNALKQMCDILNGERTVRMGLNHNPFLPPLGQYGKARIIQDETGEYLLTADPVLLDKYEILDESDELLHNFNENCRGFNEVNFEAPDEITVDIDFHNFHTFDSRANFCEEIKKKIDPNIEINEKIRKELYPDPELIITLSQYFILYKLIKPIGEKITEKVTEKISTDLADYYEKIKKIFKTSLKYFDTKYKKITLIIEIPTSEIHIELATQINIDNIQPFLEQITSEEIDRIIGECMKMKYLFQGEKIQYIFNENNKWEFTYLLTKTALLHE